MIFSLYDIKAEVFGRLFEAETLEVAKRMFVSLLLTNDINNITQYPADFTLYCVGDWDNKSGTGNICPPYVVLTGFEAKLLAKQYSGDTVFVQDDLMKGDSNEHREQAISSNSDFTVVEQSN